MGEWRRIEKTEVFAIDMKPGFRRWLSLVCGQATVKRQAFTASVYVTSEVRLKIGREGSGASVRIMRAHDATFMSYGVMLEAHPHG